MVQMLRLLTVAAALALAPLAALAGPLDDAKAAGLVGERVDGFLGIVPGSAPAEVRALVEEVNDKRRTKYQEVAKQRGVAMEAVAAIAGEKLVRRADRGTYVAGPDGRWKQK